MQRRIALGVTLIFCGATNALAGDTAPSGRKHTPIERMAPERLKATHEDARRIQSSWRRLPSLPGLIDFRAILHAHAQDSAHTGGTRMEMVADAKRMGVDAILLTDHFRPPRDFIDASWRGTYEGILFLPGSEDRGFLLYPTHSIIDQMKAPLPAFIEAVRADGGLIFLSHIEERPDHPMAGLDGMEIYNRHADAKKDPASRLAIVMKLTDPATLRELQTSLRLYPDELFAAQVEYPADYLAKWDAETKHQRLTGVAANDCHHNNILVVKMVDAETVKIGTNVDADSQMKTVSAKLRPGIRSMTAGHQPGDVLARVDLDPYARSFQNVSTHILAPELTEEAFRNALRSGHAYVSHDWMCDPTGFRFFWTTEAQAEPRHVQGDEVAGSRGGRLVAEFPVSCHIRLLRAGQVIAEERGARLDYAVDGPGAYRIEGWLELGGERRPWVYSNPIYVRN